MDLTKEFQKGRQAITDALLWWQITAVDWDPAVEGGLVLTLYKVDSENTWAPVEHRKVTLGFTELGMWLEKIEKLPDDVA